MEMKECEEKLDIIKKLHTSYDVNDKIIWYKPKSAKSLTISTYLKEEYFDLNNVGLLSLSNNGILVQSKENGIKKMNPFPLNTITDINVE